MDEIRGDRRRKPRTTPDRRDHARTPGKFKTACDAAYRVWRLYEREVQQEMESLSTETKVLLQEQAQRL